MENKKSEIDFDSHTDVCDNNNNVKITSTDMLVAYIKSKCNGIVTKTSEGITITHSTGELIVSSLITNELIYALDLDKLNKTISIICLQHHYDLVNKINKNRYITAEQESNFTLHGNIVITDTECPNDKNFIIMHPKTFSEYKDTGIKWQK